MTITRLIKKYNFVKYTEKSDPDTIYYSFPSSIPSDGHAMKICNGEIAMAGYIMLDDNTIYYCNWVFSTKPDEHIRKLHKQLIECSKQYKTIQIKRKIVELEEDFK